MTNKLFVKANQKTYLIGSVFITQEVDDFGVHRIVIDNKASLPRGYLGIAKLTVPAGTFCGTSEFYGDTLPRVFQVVSGHSVKAMED